MSTAITLNADIDKYTAAITQFEGDAPELSQAGVPTANLRSRWFSVKQSIFPHLTGNMPAIINEAFNTEFKRQKAYRRRIYTSDSAPMLEQAMLNIYKIVQSDDFAINYSVDGSDSVELLLERVFWDNTKLSGGNIKKIIFNALYRFRASDPNGYIGVFPQSEKGLRTMSIVLYPSENIIYQSRDVCIFAVPSQRGVLSGVNVAHVYTRNSTFAVNMSNYGIITTNNLTAGGWRHDGGELGCVVAGGTAQIAEEVNGSFPVENYDADEFRASNFSPPTVGSINVVHYNASDWSYAVSIMNKVEAANNNLNVSTYRHIFPKLVGVPINCQECKGNRTIERRHPNGEFVMIANAVGQNVIDRVECPACKGMGTSPIGVQDIIEAPVDSGDSLGGKTSLRSLKDGVIAYVTPEISTTQMMFDLVNSYKLELKETLNLQKYANLAESGEAKKIDNEASMPRMRAICEGLAMLIRQTLRNIVNLDHAKGFGDDTRKRDKRLQSISVSVPSYFDTQTVAEAEAAYNESLKGDSISQRFDKKMAMLKKQDRNKEDIARFQIAYIYTAGANMYTFDELSAQLGMGIVTEADFWIIQHAETLLERLKLDSLIATGKAIEFAGMIDYKPLFAQLDKIKEEQAEKIKAAKPAPPAPMSDALKEEDDDMEDDEEDEPDPATA